MWRMKEYRVRARLSQRELAERLGVSQVAISKWEKQRTNPSVDQISELAQVLNVPVQYLFASDDESSEGNGRGGSLGPELQIALHALKGAGYSEISEEGRAKLFEFVEELRDKYPAHPVQESNKRAQTQSSALTEDVPAAQDAADGADA